MRPHHFQQQQRYNDYLDNQRFRAMNDLSWGFTELTLNNELLAQGKIMIDSASGTLPDGTVFSIPDQDALPDPLHPQNFPDERSRNIYLALPVASDVRNEISDGRRIGRYRLNYADVRDLHSEEGDARTLTLTALDELEAPWHQQQTLVREIIALRQQLLGVAEDDAAPLPDADTVEDTQPESESEQDNTGAVPADEADREQPEETAETVSPVQRLAQLTAELDALHNDRLLVSPHVDKKQIAAVIAEWTGVPLNRLSQNEMSVITDLTKWLGDTIKGQDLAIASLHKHLLTARADLRCPGRPLGAFLLAGPSGVGKTETVLQLAELLYGGRQYLTTINMSEFQEKHTVSRLIGSPPGYVGYGEGGVLTEAIRQKPYSVVLLDEVEKAHPDVLNLFYQAFDKGEMADGEGRLIDCKNIVFFLTSNLGYQVIVEHADDPETMQEVLYPVLADFFKPALLARMEVVPYLPLSKETLATIIAGKLARLDNVLRSRFGAEVVIEPEVTDEIMSRVTRAENGARMLESVIDGDMLPPLSLLLLQKMAANTAIARIRLSAVDGAFTADVEDAQNDESVTKDETVL
ncbi:TPA: type VI secretion system baseplate subunit TssK [Escherichia coli]